jgi:hypothetical protein
VEVRDAPAPEFTRKHDRLGEIGERQRKAANAWRPVPERFCQGHGILSWLSRKFCDVCRQNPPRRLPQDRESFGEFHRTKLIL